MRVSRLTKSFGFVEIRCVS